MKYIDKRTATLILFTAARKTYRRDKRIKKRLDYTRVHEFLKTGKKKKKNYT